jgi:hypothetical protein
MMKGERMVRNLMQVLMAASMMLSSAAVFAQDAEPLLPVKQQAQASQKAPLVRSESLELPGLTACHQCEWRPKPHEMAAPDQCGTAPDGKGKIAEFECGFSQACDRVCNFVRCISQ